MLMQPQPFLNYKFIKIQTQNETELSTNTKPLEKFCYLTLYVSYDSIVEHCRLMSIS